MRKAVTSGLEGTRDGESFLHFDALGPATQAGC